MKHLRLLLLLLLPSLASAPALGQGLVKFDKSEVIIETAGGERHSFEVELALTPQQQAQGLMFRRSMKADAGMLFVSDRDRQFGMWMKNTFIPLDMLFLDAGGRILHIAERTVPHSQALISPDSPARAILELNGGTASRLGIRAGDQVRHPLLAGK